MDNTVGRLQFSFQPHQFDVIVGSLLGDARLECRSIGKRHPITARLRIQQSEKQREYVFWKYKILQSFVLRGPRRIMVWHDRERHKYHYSWYFHSKSMETLGSLQKAFYQGRIKVLPDNIFSLLTPQMLAVWFMDDGSYMGNGFTLNTHCFSQEEQRKIVRFLNTRFHAKARIVPDRTKFKVFIPKASSKDFMRAIQPFVIKSMIYKTAIPVTTSLRKERDTEVSPLYNTSVLNQAGVE